VERICWTKPRERNEDCIRGRGLGGCEGGDGEADLEGPVEREGVVKGRAGMSSPKVRRAMMQARGVKQERCLGLPAVDTPVHHRQERSQADDDGVGGKHGLMKHPLPGEPRCASGAGAVWCASAPGVPGHTGGRASGPYRSMARSGRASPEEMDQPAEWARAPRATGGTAPACQCDDGC
jgi:hypothetical protein